MEKIFLKFLTITFMISGFQVNQAKANDKNNQSTSQSNTSGNSDSSNSAPVFSAGAIASLGTAGGLAVLALLGYIINKRFDSKSISKTRENFKNDIEKDPFVLSLAVSIKSSFTKEEIVTQIGDAIYKSIPDKAIKLMQQQINKMNNINITNKSIEEMNIKNINGLELMLKKVLQEINQNLSEVYDGLSLSKSDQMQLEKNAYDAICKGLKIDQQSQKFQELFKSNVERPLINEEVLPTQESIIGQQEIEKKANERPVQPLKNPTLSQSETKVEEEGSKIEPVNIETIWENLGLDEANVDKEKTLEKLGQLSEGSSLNLMIHNSPYKYESGELYSLSSGQNLGKQMENTGLHEAITVYKPNEANPIPESRFI